MGYPRCQTRSAPLYYSGAGPNEGHHPMTRFLGRRYHAVLLVCGTTYARRTISNGKSLEVGSEFPNMDMPSPVFFKDPTSGPRKVNYKGISPSPSFSFFLLRESGEGWMSYSSLIIHLSMGISCCSPSQLFLQVTCTARKHVLRGIGKPE